MFDLNSVSVEFIVLALHKIIFIIILSYIWIHTHFTSPNTVRTMVGFQYGWRCLAIPLLRHLVKVFSMQPIRSNHCSFYFRVLFAKFICWSKYFPCVGGNKVFTLGGVTSLMNTAAFLLLVLHLSVLSQNINRGCWSQTD